MLSEIGGLLAKNQAIMNKLAEEEKKLSNVSKHLKSDMSEVFSKRSSGLFAYKVLNCKLNLNELNWHGASAISAISINEGLDRIISNLHEEYQSAITQINSAYKGLPL
jgi:hypothetical protein